MNTLLQQILNNTTQTTTENGMATYTTSYSKCLDLFFLCGASRNKSDDEIIRIFSEAYNENSEIASLIFAYNRDVRGGNGERRFSRIIMKYLANNNAKINWSYLTELGRWDDLFSLFNTPSEKEALSIIASKWWSNTDMTLFAKWMPRKGKIAGKIRAYLKLDPKTYRKTLVNWTNVIETSICQNRIQDINYSHVPSKANTKYSHLFLRKDDKRRRLFLSNALSGKEKINSSVAYPYEIVRMLNVEFNGNRKPFTCDENQAAFAMWDQLPNYMDNTSNIRILPMCDFSGSMNGLPLMISMSLGMYISERNEGAFKNAFLTFSSKPKLQYFSSNATIADRIRQMILCNEQSTNLEAAFKLILDNAKSVNVQKSDMPTHILIISDMEFDRASNYRHTAMEMIKNEYMESGYDMPNIIFWNVNSRTNNIPIRFNTNGVGLISGASPSILKAVLSGEVEPLQIMKRAIVKERYIKLLK